MKLLLNFFKQDLMIVIVILCVLTIIAFMFIRVTYKTHIEDSELILMIFCEVIVLFFIMFNLITLKLYEFSSKSDYVLLVLEGVIINYVIINFVYKVLIDEMQLYTSIDKFVHLIATLSMINIFNVISRNIVGAERGKKVTFSEYKSTFFLMYFWMVGIWFIHPRLQKIIVAKIE